MDRMGRGKLIGVLAGEIFDVAVDIRAASPTFGKWTAQTLSSQNARMLYIPPGFAHGFCVMKDGTEVLYKTTQPYSPPHERGIAWNDRYLAVRWPDIGMDYVISSKDRKNPSFESVFGAPKK